MSDTKHAPGPWRVFDRDDTEDTFGRDAWRITEDGTPGEEEQIARVYGNAATAALIARAPELLAENGRLRVALGTIVSDLALDSDSGVCPPEYRARLARYVRDLRATLEVSE